MSAPRRVLLVGWDSADWKVITPLMDEGKMPHVQQLVEGGVMGNLAYQAAQTTANDSQESRHRRTSPATSPSTAPAIPASSSNARLSSSP